MTPSPSPSSRPAGPVRRPSPGWPVWAVVGVVVALAVLGGVSFLARAPGSPPPVVGGAASSPATATSAPGTPTPSATSTPNGTDGTDGSPGTDDGLEIGVVPTQVPRSGSGTTTVLDVGGADSPRSGREVRYTVEIEGGLGVSPTYFAHKVRRVLQDERGWEVRDGVHFVNVTPRQRAAGAETDIRVILASPAYVDRNCLPLRTGGHLSCHRNGKVLLNVDRWAHGAETYGDDVLAYRVYLVSHEVGHSIGKSHAQCPGPGALAPVMVQQTKTLQGCRPWPYPVRPRD